MSICIRKLIEVRPSSSSNAKSRVRTTSSDPLRWRFGGIPIHVQIHIVLIGLFLPVIWGLSRETSVTKGMNNQSALENFWLRSRLQRIKSSIKNDFSCYFSNGLEPESKSTNAKMPTFIFPGAGGVDELVLELKAANPNSKIIDWKEYRGSILTAGYDSEAVGEAIAELFLDSTNDVSNNNQNNNKQEMRRMSSTSLSSVRFIGISVGAFAANVAATILNWHQNDKNDPLKPLDIHLVLLDPFCGRGIFGPNYGRDNFGKHATTALQILNTDDPVPTTNEPLPFCYCIDVTDAPEKESFVLLPGDTMHSWPLAYFIRHYHHEEDMDDPKSPLYNRGMVKKV